MNFDFDTGTIDAIQYLDASQLPPAGGTAGVLKVIGTGSLQLPTGTTAEQPSGILGMVRGNSTTSNLEFHTGTSWAPVVVENPDGSIDAQVNHRVNTYASLSTLAGGNGEISVMSDLRGAMIHNGVSGGAVPVIADYIALDVNLINYIGNIGQIDPVAKVIELWSQDFIANVWDVRDSPMHIRVQLMNGYFIGQTVRLQWTPMDRPGSTGVNYPYTRIMSVTPCDIGTSAGNTYGLFIAGAGLYGGHNTSASCTVLQTAQSFQTVIAPPPSLTPFYRDYIWDGSNWKALTSTYVGHSVCQAVVPTLVAGVISSIMIPSNCAFTVNVKVTGTMTSGAAGAIVGEWIIRGVYPDYNRGLVGAAKAHAVHTLEHIGSTTNPVVLTDVTAGIGTINGSNTGGKGAVVITAKGFTGASVSTPYVFHTDYAVHYMPL